MSMKDAVTTDVPLNPQEAFALVVHEHGSKQVAAALLMNRGTLQNKCSTDEDSRHKPTLQDVVNVTRATGDMRILESLDRLFNRAGYELAPGPVSDEAVLELLCTVGSEQGQMHAALHRVLKHKRITAAALRPVRAEAFDLINAVLTLVQRLEGLVDE